MFNKIYPIIICIVILHQAVIYLCSGFSCRKSGLSESHIIQFSVFTWRNEKSETRQSYVSTICHNKFCIELLYKTKIVLTLQCTQYINLNPRFLIYAVSAYLVSSGAVFIKQRFIGADKTDIRKGNRFAHPEKTNFTLFFFKPTGR